MISSVDNSRIEAMLAQMRTAVANVESPQTPTLDKTEQTQGGIDFAKELQTHLDRVNHIQTNAEQLSHRFSMGDDSVNLSDVMIAGQKSSIALQTTIQVRNKMVSAYHDIMNMQI